MHKFRNSQCFETFCVFVYPYVCVVCVYMYVFAVCANSFYIQPQNLVLVGSFWKLAMCCYSMPCNLALPATQCPFLPFPHLPFLSIASTSPIYIMNPYTSSIYDLPKAALLGGHRMCQEFRMRIQIHTHTHTHVYTNTYTRMRSEAKFLLYTLTLIYTHTRARPHSNDGAFGRDGDLYN